MIRWGWLVAAGLTTLTAALTMAAAVHFDLPSTGKKRFSGVEIASSRAAVLLFLGLDCPISNRYSPLLHQLEMEYQKRGVRFFAVFTGADAREQAASKHLADFGLEMPGLVDGSGVLAGQTGATVTPEAVILSPQLNVLYRGRIDNRYVDWGKTRPDATQRDLKDALEAVLAGKPVTQPVTKALGCSISLAPASSAR